MTQKQTKANLPHNSHQGTRLYRKDASHVLRLCCYHMLAALTFPR